jgi:hypothetical protein
MALSHARILLNVGNARKSGPPTADRQDKSKQGLPGRSARELVSAHWVSTTCGSSRHATESYDGYMSDFRHVKSASGSGLLR